MSYRVGRRNPHTIYWIDDEGDSLLGEVAFQPYQEPEDDVFIGSCVSAGAAANLVARANRPNYFVMSGELMSDGDIIDRLRKENSDLKRKLNAQQSLIDNYRNQLSKLRRMKGRIHALLDLAEKGE